MGSYLIVFSASPVYGIVAISGLCGAQIHIIAQFQFYFACAVVEQAVTASYKTIVAEYSIGSSS